MKSQETEILIIGSGIIGLAHAYEAAKAGKKVVVVEKSARPIGASIRNFGLIWPIGQAPGTAFSMALKSVQVWKRLSKEAGFWLKNTGAMFIAKHGEEMDVLEEFQENAYHFGYNCKLLSNNRIAEHLGGFSSNQTKGALLSDTELTVDPAEAIPAITKYLEHQYKVTFHYGKAVTRIEMPYIIAGKTVWKADRVFVCSGQETSLLYAEKLATENLQHCQLQMMAGTSQQINPKNFPAIGSGLSMIHYPSFRYCTHLEALREFYKCKAPLAIKYGINILVSSNKNNEFIIGDSHHYGDDAEIHINHEITSEIIKQLNEVYEIPDLVIKRHWLGKYLKTVGGAMYNTEVEDGVTLVTGLGGSGMTLSFGLAQENIMAYTGSNTFMHT
ncbi:MAG: TIGR03364 family FAD-dependent oxidoreductase [Leptolyngbya sp. SIO3F4]|nr:TIGR03364 family FAD-dependent oxidoreductase [Leptolyngbya sp. SIO3F4]